jgi:hypothetical protein
MNLYAELRNFMKYIGRRADPRGQFVDEHGFSYSRDLDQPEPTAVPDGVDIYFFTGRTRAAGLRDYAALPLVRLVLRGPDAAGLQGGSLREVSPAPGTVPERCPVGATRTYLGGNWIGRGAGARSARR